MGPGYRIVSFLLHIPFSALSLWKSLYCQRIENLSAIMWTVTLFDVGKEATNYPIPPLKWLVGTVYLLFSACFLLGYYMSKSRCSLEFLQDSATAWKLESFLQAVTSCQKNIHCDTRYARQKLKLQCFHLTLLIRVKSKFFLLVLLLVKLNSGT